MTKLYSVNSDIDRINELVISSPYVDPSCVNLRINFMTVLNYLGYECYRENMVSFAPMRPLLELPQVEISEADYIIYMNPYARCEDFSEKVLWDLRQINKIRHSTAEIIVVGKSANAEQLLNGEIPRITFWGDHFTEKLGKKFGIDMCEQYFVYDEAAEHLAIWPVDGCNNKCRFCRRSYMYIKFESLPLSTIKENLDYIRDIHPEWLETISLRAENLCEYGIDIYGKPMLHHLLKLINNYDEVKQINFPIGISIGETTDDILQALCDCKKIGHIGMNLESGTDRLLKFIGKPNTIEQSKKVVKAVRNSHPETTILSTVMLGLPSEQIVDVIELAKLIGELEIDDLQINYYISAKRQPLAKYPQLSLGLRQYHLEILLKELPKYLKQDILIEHWKIIKKPSRKTVRKLEKLKEENKKQLLPSHLITTRLWRFEEKRWYKSR